MTGRENSEDNFEQEWRGAFDGWSEEAPSTVWRDIDRQLAYETVKSYKTKMMIYQWVAAAAILLSVSFGTIQYFGSDSNQYVISAAATIDAPKQTTVASIVVEDNPSTEIRNLKKEQNQSYGSSNGVIGMVAVADSRESKEEIEGLTPVHFELLNVNPIKDQLDAEIASNHEEVFLYYLPVYSRANKQDSKSDESKYWAGINVGSSNFNPNYSSSSNTLASNLGVRSDNGYSQNTNSAFNSESPNLRENMSPGETVTMGVNFGLNLGERWRLHSGVQYARSGAITETNILVRTSTLQEGIPATGQSKDIPAVAKLVASENVVEYDFEDVNMNNVFEFTSIPVKAGYLILDQKISLEINAGLVTNIYLGNSLTTENPDVAELTIGPGDASPYRDFSFSGLAGVQFGYRFMKRIDVIVEPNYSHAINTLTKSSSNFSTSPTGFGFMTGLRYNFN